MLDSHSVAACIHRGASDQRQLARYPEPLRPHRGQDLIGVGRLHRHGQTLGRTAECDLARMPGPSDAPPAANTACRSGFRDFPLCA